MTETNIAISLRKIDNAWIGHIWHVDQSGNGVEIAWPDREGAVGLIIEKVSAMLEGEEK